MILLQAFKLFQPLRRKFTSQFYALLVSRLTMVVFEILSVASLLAIVHISIEPTKESIFQLLGISAFDSKIIFAICLILRVVLGSATTYRENLMRQEWVIYIRNSIRKFALSTTANGTLKESAATISNAYFVKAETYVAMAMTLPETIGMFAMTLAYFALLLFHGYALAAMVFGIAAIFYLIGRWASVFSSQQSLQKYNIEQTICEQLSDDLKYTDWLLSSGLIDKRDTIFKKTHQQLLEVCRKLYLANSFYLPSLQMAALVVVGLIALYALNIRGIQYSQMAALSVGVGVPLMRLFSISRRLTLLLNAHSETLIDCIEVNRFLSNNKLKDIDTLPPAKPLVRDIQFKDLSFHYMNSSAQILRSLNLTLNPGVWLSVSGHNGSGKSTFGRILTGLLKPTGGTLLVNGLQTDSIQAGAGAFYLPHEPAIFASTLRENLDPLNKYDDKDLLRELIAMGFHDIYLLAKNHLNNNVGESSVQLSLGQKQKVALARVVFMAPSLLVLDEASSSLDLLSEFNFLKYLKEKYSDIILVFISHRETNLSLFEQHYRLENQLLVRQSLVSHNENMRASDLPI
jgi:ABC-type transport system involved in cytochrome bd biosynthesis fused ATPase/permease subunit